ncbi:MAG: diacylglycerol kinase family lipid kinase [Proteobacteria bacterium]|nr:diacylglycerol kinase family lipid kinase [Pseudomonadota bacterium]
MSLPVLAIVNPAAGGGRAQRRWTQLARALEAAGVAFEQVTTHRAGEATELARAGLAAGPRTLLAVGGDGTLHEVLNGALGGARRPRLAVAPFGTGNDWAREMAAPREPAAFARMLAAGRVRAVDAGRIDYREAGAPAARFFINVAGAGYDSYVLEQLEGRSKQPLAYLRAVIAGLARYRAPRFKLAGDGVRLEGPLFVAFAMLGQACGGGMRFAPVARPDDGLLDLVAIEHLSRASALWRLAKIYTGTLLRDPAVRHATLRELSIDAEPPARLEADGQLLGHTPATLTVLPKAVEFVVP